MSNRKIRVLGIAPYDGIKILMQNVAQKRNDITLDVYVGDLREGVKIAKANLSNDYDIIISRGGTAELLRQATTIPVIEIVLTVYDILRAIKLSEVYSLKYAIVGFSSITKEAHLLCDLLQYNIDIFTIQAEEELCHLLSDLKEKGYRMVLGDMVTNTTAKRMNMNAMLITSGIESVENAFNQAVMLNRSFQKIRSKSQLFSKIIFGFSSFTVIFNEKNELWFSSLPANIVDTLVPYLRQEVKNLLLNSIYSTFKNIQDYLYSIEGKVLNYEDNNYYAFYIERTKTPIMNGKYGIVFMDRKDIETEFYEHTFNFIEENSNLLSTIENFSQLKQPIILIGEPGTQKFQAARYIYLKGTQNAHPFISIDFGQISEKSWGFLTNHYNSPFNDNGNTLYLKDINKLSEQGWKKLLSIIIDTNLAKRNRIIISCTVTPNEVLISLNEFINKLSCPNIYLPPLRERLNDLPVLSSLYLNKLNLELAKQIIGFTPEAYELLKNFHWPYNYSQYQRVLYELVAITNSPYISQESVASILAQESKISRSENMLTFSNSEKFLSDSVEFNYDRTLAEITIDVIKHTLSKCNGNQSAAAKKLGISRSTLWRYLNKIS